MGATERMKEGARRSMRLPFDSRREVVWRALWKFHFSKYVDPSHCVLELGCGYAHFINNVKAKQRIAIDSWPGFVQHLADGVEGHVGSVSDLSFLSDHSVDFAFASNLFEHLTMDDFSLVLDQLRRKLTKTGVLALLQPNYRYAYKEYFDDFTHITVYSHESLCDFLEINAFGIVDCIPRFMPLTVKHRRMVISESLIRLYLKMPVKPLGKQMLVVAQPADFGQL
jgi:SAM-dependent methyltransferase